MLRENPNSRPNIFQVMREGCLMQGVEVPIKDVRWALNSTPPYAALTLADLRWAISV